MKSYHITWIGLHNLNTTTYKIILFYCSTTRSKFFIYPACDVTSLAKHCHIQHSSLRTGKQNSIFQAIDMTFSIFFMETHSFIVSSCKNGYFEEICFQILLSREMLMRQVHVFHSSNFQLRSNCQSVLNKVTLLMRIIVLIIINDTLVCRCAYENVHGCTHVFFATHQ